MHAENESSFFSVKKCGIAGCTSCLESRLPPDVFSKLHHLPDPIPSETNEGHYQTFDEFYGTETSEKYLPSKNSSKRSNGIPFNQLKQHTNNTRITILQPLLQYASFDFFEIESISKYHTEI